MDVRLPSAFPRKRRYNNDSLAYKFAEDDVIGNKQAQPVPAIFLEPIKNWENVKMKADKLQEIQKSMRKINLSLDICKLTWCRGNL